MTDALQHAIEYCLDANLQEEMTIFNNLGENKIGDYDMCHHATNTEHKLHPIRSEKF